MDSTPLDREPDAHLRDAARVRARALEAVKHWVGVANQHAARKGLPTVPVPITRFDLRGRTGGMARFKNGGELIDVRINDDLLIRYPVRMIQQTVPHEIAHVVTRRWFPGASSHGREWQSVMALFGKPADRCHDMVVKPVGGGFAYACGCPGRQIVLGARKHQNVVDAGRKLRCRKCKTMLRFVGESPTV